MKNKELSIIIVNMNGWRYLNDLLDSIKSSNAKDYEIVVVDNGSETDHKKILDYAKKQNTVKLITLHKNFGPAMARNIGVRNSSGRYVAFLDNDTIVEKNWALNAINYFKNHKKVGVIQCKLLLQSDHKKIDYVGEYLGSNGFLVQECPAGTIDRGQFNKPKKILAAKSAGMFITREAFDLAGGFDDDYFIYVEETDLGWRSWIAGYEAHYLPDSVVYHHFGTSTVILGQKGVGFLAKYHGPKNYLMTLYKNLPQNLLWRILPVHFLLWFCFALYKVLTLNFLDSYYMLSGLLYFIVNFKKISKKRDRVQSIKDDGADEMIKDLVVMRPLWYFINKATKKHKIGNAKSY